MFTLKRVSMENQKIIEDVKTFSSGFVEGTNYSMRIKLTKTFDIDEEEARGVGEVV